MSDPVPSTVVGVDDECPYAALAVLRPDTFAHVCRRRDGRPVRLGVDTCHAGAAVHHAVQFIELLGDRYAHDAALRDGGSV